MKYDNVIPAQLCFLIKDEQLLERIKAELSSYQIDYFTDIESLKTKGLEPSVKLILCQHDFVSDNVEHLAQLCRTFPGVYVLLIGSSVPVTSQINALKHGARGYFNQDLPVSKLDEAIQLILHGEVWVERQVISSLIDELTQVPKLTVEQQAAVDSLTPKEMEVAKLVSHGATNKMIARAMDITERTVKAHLTTIFQKMSLADRLSLAIFFRDMR